MKVNVSVFSPSGSGAKGKDFFLSFLPRKNDERLMTDANFEPGSVHLYIYSDVSVRKS